MKHSPRRCTTCRDYAIHTKAVRGPGNWVAKLGTIHLADRDQSEERETTMNNHETDAEFEDKKLTDVTDGDGWFSLTFDDGWSFSLDKKYGIVPRVGQTARLWGEGIGRPVRGLAIDGVIAYYRTAEEEEAKRLADIEEMNATKRARFETAREDHDRRIAALPRVFRERFRRFLKHNPDFRWKFEDYELFCCEEAVRLLGYATTAAAGGATSAVEWIRAFAAASSETQKKLAPDMKIGEHSGNTFGFTCRIAHLYLEDESLVPRMHGALAPLVGCEEYGCPQDPVVGGAKG
ncbi:MAG TPA: hypothetical protein VHG72_13895 [Polyangia bacterium]|nr:hypothetical protein [Polyangia bacterium]